MEAKLLPFAILADELAALRRFHECAEDGQGYDVPAPMMKRLASIGLVRRISGDLYEHTTLGLSALIGDFDTPAQLPASPPSVSVDEELLDDTQHSTHPDCEDGPCPVRAARAALSKKASKE